MLQRVTAFVLVLVLAVTGLWASPARAEEDGADGYVSEQVVVKLTSTAYVAKVARDYQLLPISQFGKRPIYLMRILDGATPPERAEQLVNDRKGRVQYAEPNYIGQAPERRQRSSWSRGDAAEYVEQWAPQKIRLAEAHQRATGSQTTVAVLDTGVDLNHPDLSGRITVGKDFVDMDNDPSEGGAAGESLAYGHGTHVAGLIALAAPDAKIMPVRVLDPDGVGNIWVLAEALRYAANPDGNTSTLDGADVINMSLSTKRRTNLLSEIVALATCEGEEDGDNEEEGGENEEEGEEDCLAGVSGGAVVVAAAGNSGSSTPEYPAAEGVSGLLSVAATTRDDVLPGFSNYGTWVNVAAPGASITSAVPGGGYATWSGTSMAAPLTAGTAALVKSSDQSLTAVEVTGRVLSTATNIGGLEPLRIDAANAVR